MSGLDREELQGDRNYEGQFQASGFIGNSGFRIPRAGNSLGEWIGAARFRRTE
jgi:hypothetical protein